MLKGFGAGTAVAFLLVAAPAAALAPVATAPAAPAPAAASADGSVSRAQGEAMVRDMFTQLDVNHDGIIDAAEQKALGDELTRQGAPAPVLAYLQKMFREGTGADGKVTLASFVGGRMAAFDRHDANHDGKLDAAEQAASRAAAEGK